MSSVSETPSSDGRIFSGMNMSLLPQVWYERRDVFAVVLPLFPKFRGKHLLLSPGAHENERRHAGKIQGGPGHVHKQASHRSQHQTKIHGMADHGIGTRCH